MSKDDPINITKKYYLNEKLIFFYYIQKWVKQLIIEETEKQY